MSEIILYGLPKGESRPYMESILSTQCKTESDIEKIKERASFDGWHSFRVARIDLSQAPNFAKTLNKGVA